MQKLTVKKIVEFRRKSDKSRRTFINNLKVANEKKDNSNPRDYWIRSLSAIKKSFKTNDTQNILNKIEEIKEALSVATHSNTITQYLHNIKVLKRFEKFDFSILKPSVDINIIDQHNENKIISIRGLQVEVTPSFVFSYENDDNNEVGAIWFVAQKDGFKKEELGMFADILNRYLKTHFSKEYDINPKFCIVVDLYIGTYIDYLQLEEGTIPKVLNSAIDEIKKII